MSTLTTLKRLVPGPLRAAGRRALRRLRQIYNGRRLLARPYADSVAADVHGARIRVPVRYKQFHSPVTHPPSRSWKTVFFELLRDDPRELFLDIGANMGQTLLEFHASGARQRYIGFEANPICAGYCNELIICNGLSATLYCCGLSNGVGQTNLLINPAIADDSGASIVADLRPEKETAAIPVVLMSLSDFRDVIAPRDVALIKIDVEGAEHLVLEGARDLLADGDPLILCEVLRSERAEIAARHAEMKARLAAQGYDVYRIVEEPRRGGDLSLLRIDTFPVEPWRIETADLNDYLFCRPAMADRLAASGRLRIAEA